MAEMYEVLLEEPHAIDTLKDPHADDCPPGCTAHKHERREVHYGQTFDVADIWPRHADVGLLVQHGLIRKVEPKPAVEAPAGKAKKDS